MKGFYKEKSWQVLIILLVINTSPELLNELEEILKLLKGKR
jgi:hypothetical protein